METQHIGTRLKQTRLEHKLTQVEFASKLFVTPSYISKVESGKEIPTEMFVKLVSHEYNVSFDWLSAGTGSMNDIDLFTMMGLSLIDNNDISDINEMKATFSNFQTSFLKLNSENQKNVSILTKELTHILKTDTPKENKSTLIQILSDFICSYSRFVDTFNSTDFSDSLDVDRLYAFLNESQSINVFNQLKDFINSLK